MLMVIFGAGASYDSLPHIHPNSEIPASDRMPLANELFENRGEFVSDRQNFPACEPIIPHLQNVGERKSVEAVLAELFAEADRYPERHRQFVALTYYLQLLIWNCQSRWRAKAGGVTNYKTLLDDIEAANNGKGTAIFVTFNYDTLFEESLNFFRIGTETLNDYVQQRYKLFKLHGSINWWHDVSFQGHRDLVSGWHDKSRVIDSAAEIRIDENIRLYQSAPQNIPAKNPIIPALAIPLQTKPKFECPVEHIGVLETLIPKVTKIITIGWRAMENHFLELLSKHLTGEVEFLSVSGNERDATETNHRIKEARILGNYDAYNAGFTEFVKSRRIIKFLTT